MTVRRLALLLLLMTLSSCANTGSDFDVTEQVTPEQIYAMIESAEASLRAVTTIAPETAAAPETDAPETVMGDCVVYWSPSGEVWHLTPDCPSLSRAKSVISGSETDAMAAGKDRLCKSCEAKTNPSS